MNYTHLSEHERYAIYVLRRKGSSIRQITRDLQRSHSTVVRELQRNGCAGSYGYHRAHQRACERRRAASTQPLKMTPAVIACIEELLVQRQWSPTKISDRLDFERFISISHETIYRHIYNDQRNGGCLYLHLRHRRRARRKRSRSPDRRGHIRNRISIEQRPSVVQQRGRIGDLELDTIVGVQHRGALVTVVDRRSLRTWIRQVPNGGAAVVTDAIIHALLPERDRIHTLTADNGKEFARHEDIAARLDASFYFAHPYHSWERDPMRTPTASFVSTFQREPISFVRLPNRSRSSSTN